MRLESLSTQVVVEQGHLGQRGHALLSPRSRKDICQHPGAGWQQVLSLEKGSLLHETVVEIPKRLPAIMQEAIVLPQMC